MKKTIYLVKDCAKLLVENNLRIFAPALMIVAVLGLAARPAFALSEKEKETLLGKLEKEIYNFHEAAPGIYRSGLVSEEAAPLLKELGVKTVLSFDNNSKRAAHEKKLLEDAGIKYVSIPWSGWDYPEDKKIKEALVLLESPEAKPILVHCKHGQERTGVAIACWRIAEQGWPAEKAYEEMEAHGFRSGRYGHLKDYVYRYAREHGQENAQINYLERAKTKFCSFFYRLRKLKPAQFN